MLLALDTATNYLNIALHDGQSLLAEQNWRIGRHHNSLLAPSIQHMLDACQVSIAELRVIGVARGPGSYSGLRIGVSFAKGMAAVNHLPLVGVSTLDILAAGQTFQNARHRLLAVIQAGRGRIISAEYRVKKGRWVMNGDILQGTWEELLQERTGAYYIAGEVNESGFEAIEAARSEDNTLLVLNPARRIRRAGFLAQEAWRRYEDGDEADFHPTLLQPIYLNQP